MGIAACENRHSLDEYGPYKTFPDAEKTLGVALEKLIGQGGGILCIPLDAPPDFQPRNLPQDLVPDGLGKPEVTIIDFRRGIEHTYVPSIGEVSSDVTGRASRILERDLASDLSWQDSFSTEMIDSRYLGGASSYLQPITGDVKAGSDRVDVPTLRGLFVGQTLLLTGQANGYGPPLEELKVKALGLDATGPHIIAGKTLASDHPQGAFLYNKNVINGLTVNDTSNCDNQSMSLAVNRVTYGIGDSFAFSGRISYQGSIMSAGGDEGAVGVAAQIEHDLDVFWGRVVSWSATNGELIYQSSPDALAMGVPPPVSPQKLGTSRPLINMNESKWKKGGKVLVIPPNYSVLGEKPATSLIIASADVDWDETVVGRFIAINVPTEYYDAGESNSLGGGTGHKVHRWWQITKVQKRADGRWKVFVERAVWWSVAESGPTLFRGDNYSTDDTKLVWLDYVIAPGAWVSDVRHGVTGNTPGNVGWASADDPRKILLTPLPATSPIFDTGDPISNPPSADVWLGTGFRARHFDNFPAVLKGASFLSENSGRVQLGAGLQIDSAARTLHKIDATGHETAEFIQKDAEAAFEVGVHILASTKVGIRIAGETQDDAIQLWQVQGRPQRITWIPEHAPESALLVDGNGTFILAGNHVSLNRKGTILQSGLSATTTPAHNLSGVNVPVSKDAMELPVAFAPNPAEDDALYGIQVECSWVTPTAVTEKSTTGFKVLFGTKAPDGATLDWLLVR
jgi:hypothetical protein